MSIATMNAAAAEELDALPSIGARLRWASGLLVLYVAFGAGSWMSGAAAWVVDGCGGRASAIVRAGEVGYVVGFVGAVIASVAWYAARCRRGRGDLSAIHLIAAMLALPVGAIAWAIFVDAIAWHHRADLVRTPVDYVIMYVLLASAIPVVVGVPLVARFCHVGRSENA